MLGLLAAFVTCSAIMTGAYWLIRRPQIGMETRLRTLSHQVAKQERSRWGKRRLSISLSDSHSAGLLAMLPSGLVRRTGERLAAAGRPTTPQAFWAIVLMTTTLSPFAAYILLLLLGGGLSGIGLLLVIALTLIGAYAPFFWLRSRVHKRQKLLRQELPDVLDLLTLCVESGLGLDAAFRRVSAEMEGVFSTEIEQMLHEVDLGKPRRDALEDLATRNAIPEISVVTSAMIQSQQMGTSLAATLRSQTQLMRLKRRQSAEQKARQASVKMAFPLVLFLMPSLFLVVLGPIAINLFRALTG